MDDNRERILDAVVQNPGITKTDIKTEVELGWGTVNHHLRLLRRDSSVDELELRRKTHYFQPSFPEDHRLMFATLRDPQSKAIIRCLEAPKRAVELVEESNQSRKIVDRHLGNLEESGTIERHGFRYKLSELYEQVWGKK